MDTTYILGRGAVKDTYNLLADGIVKLMRALAAVAGVPVRRWAEALGYQRYVGSSVKGEAAIDWSNRRARRKLLGQSVADADRLLELARQAQDGLPADADGEVRLKEGVSRDRMVSVHDPQMRHGHKSKRKRLTDTRRLSWWTPTAG